MTDASSLDAVDWSDPCQRAAALNKVYFTLLSGESVVEVRTRTLDAEEMVRYTKADMDRLNIERRSAESACARATGQPDPNRRFAIVGGARADVPYPADPRRPF